MLAGNLGSFLQRNKFKHRSAGRSPSRKLTRSEYGVYLIEFLAALVISTTIAQILIDSISQTHRFSTDGQEQLLATAIGEEVIDFGRGSGYAYLETLIPGSPHTLPINTGDAPVDPAFPRLLVMDLRNLEWSQPAQNNKFSGTVTESVAFSPTWPDMIQLNVTVQWSQSGGMLRQYKLTALVSKYGIHG